MASTYTLTAGDNVIGSRTDRSRAISVADEHYLEHGVVVDVTTEAGTLIHRTGVELADVTEATDEVEVEAEAAEAEAEATQDEEEAVTPDTTPTGRARQFTRQQEVTFDYEGELPEDAGPVAYVRVQTQTLIAPKVDKSGWYVLDGRPGHGTVSEHANTDDAREFVNDIRAEFVAAQATKRREALAQVRADAAAKREAKAVAKAAKLEAEAQEKADRAAERAAAKAERERVKAARKAAIEAEAAAQAAEDEAEVEAPVEEPELVEA